MEPLLAADEITVILKRMRFVLSMTSLLCVAMSTIACGSDGDESTVGGNPHVFVKPDASPVNVHGQLTEVTAFEPVTNANVCVLGSDPAICSTTDADGWFGVETASDDEIALDITASSIVRTIVVLGSREGDGFVDGRTFVSSSLDGLVEVLGVAADPEKGHLLVLKSTEGATATLSSGESPVYFGPGGVPVTGSETGKGGGVGFFNVTPGTVELDFESTSTCQLPLWTGSQPSAGRLPIVAGALTTVSRFYCE